MQERIQRTIESFIYEPGVYGLTNDLWYISRGVPLLATEGNSPIGGTVLRLPAQSSNYNSSTAMYSVPSFIGGRFTANIAFPGLPEDTEDGFIFGLTGIMSNAPGAFFEIDEGVASFVTRDASNNEETTEITLDASFAGNAIPFEIEWNKSYMRLLIGGREAAWHGKYVPPMEPMKLFLMNSSDAATSNLGVVDIELITFLDTRVIAPYSEFSGANRNIVLADVDAGDAADETYEFYFDASGVKNFALQYDFAGTGTGTLTIEGTQEEAVDSTRDVSELSFQDVTNSLFGTTSVNSSSMFIADTDVTMKAYKVKLVLSGSDTDTDYKIVINTRSK